MLWKHKFGCCISLCAHRNKKKRLGIKGNLYTILQVLSITVFEKTPLVQAVSGETYNNEKPKRPIQLKLFKVVLNETQLLPFWTPAFAGVTPYSQSVIPAKAGIQEPLVV